MVTSTAEIWDRVVETRPDVAGATVVRDEVLQSRKGKAEVRRLSLAGASFGAVVLKRDRTARAAHEAMVYREFLAPAGMGEPDFIGVAPDEDGVSTWLVVEDVAGQPYSAAEPVHRELATQWLGRLHRVMRHHPKADRLPTVGVDRYRAMLEEVSAIVATVRANPVLAPPHVADLDDLDRLLAETSSHWGSVAAACERVQPTLVHGSFSRRNMRVVESSSGPVLRVFDWGAAGWGVPARDVAKLVSAGVGGDLEGYAAAPTDTREGLVVVGGLFRVLEHLRWTAPRLAYEWVDGPLATVRRHRDELRMLLDSDTMRGR